jgi:dipeptidyl-peptidase-4
MKQVLAAMVAGMIAAGASAAGIGQAPLSLQRVFADPPLAGQVPRALTIAPDGAHVAYLKPRADDQLRFDLWLRPTGEGEARMAVDSLALSSGPVTLSEAELARRERARLAGTRGITEYRWSPDGRSLLVPLDGDVWLAPLDATPRRLTESSDSEVDAQLSPRGTHASWVRGQNLYLYDLASGRERRLTPDGGGAITWGLPEFVAEEEMKRTTGAWWAPDDRRIAVARVDEANVAIAVRAAIGSDGTRVTEQRYPFAGTANARVSLHVFPVGGRGRPVEVDLGPKEDIYLARVAWLSPETLIVQRQPRDQTRLDYLKVDAKTGRSRLLFSETAATWINLHDDFAPLADGRRFLFTSEETGFRHVWLWDGQGRRQVTRGDWPVDALLGVDEEAGTILFSAFADTPLEKGLYRAALDGSAPPVRVADPGFWVEASADARGRQAVVSRSAPGQPPQVALLDTLAGTRAWIAENRVEETPWAAHAGAFVAPRFGTIEAADGQAMHWTMLVPPDLPPGTRAPVFFEVYGGPGVQRVRRAWGSPLHQHLVRAGWVVFMLDNRGTANRGRAFEAPLHRGVGDIEVQDQMRALAFLKQQPFIDPDRVALYGWSYGGYMVLRLMTEHPQAFRAGVSGAPVTDWTLYDTHYTERYLGNPALERGPYDASDVTGRAGRLARPLLLLHGLADDNVVFDHSAKMMAALQQAGRPFETMVYPGQTHRIAGATLQTHMWAHIMSFLEREVRGRPAAP